jgi:hypothetical protein
MVAYNVTYQLSDQPTLEGSSSITNLGTYQIPDPDINQASYLFAYKDTY